MASPSADFLGQDLDILSTSFPYEAFQLPNDHHLDSKCKEVQALDHGHEFMQELSMAEALQEHINFDELANPVQMLQSPYRYQQLASPNRRSVSEPPVAWQKPDDHCDQLFTMRPVTDTSAVVFHRDGQRLDTTGYQKPSTAKSKRKRPRETTNQNTCTTNKRRTNALMPLSHPSRQNEQYRQISSYETPQYSEPYGSMSRVSVPRSSPQTCQISSGLMESSDTVNISAAVLKSIVKEAVLEAFAEVNSSHR